MASVMLASSSRVGLALLSVGTRIPGLQVQGIRAASSKGRSGSSNRWLARQKADPFVAARAEEGFVSRGAFKLKQLAERTSLLGRGKCIVDLGAAPGGWTQVAVQSGAKVFAVDLLPLDQQAASGATVLQGDFLSEELHEALRSSILSSYGRRGDAREGEELSAPEAEALRGEAVGKDGATSKTQSQQERISLDAERPLEDPSGAQTKDAPAPKDRDGRLVDIVLSDMMANMSGNQVRDRANSLDLLKAAFLFAARNIRCTHGSKLVMKYFESQEAQDFRRKVLEKAFNSVTTVKVAASRKTSSEMYLVASGPRRSVLSQSAEELEVLMDV